MKFAMVVLAVVAVLAAGLWAAETMPGTGTKPATQPGLLAIRYQRTGGFAGTNDVIEITPAGAVVLQGRLMGNGKGQLTAEQMGKLVPLFADWGKLKANYPAPAGSADGFVIKIRYGNVEVTASDMNQAVPEGFKKVQEALEKIGADVKGK